LPGGGKCKPEVKKGEETNVGKNEKKGVDTIRCGRLYEGPQRTILQKKGGEATAEGQKKG